MPPAASKASGSKDGLEAVKQEPLDDDQEDGHDDQEDDQGENAGY